MDWNSLQKANIMAKVLRMAPRKDRSVTDDPANMVPRQSALDHERPGGHALEAPTISPDDLLGTGIPTKLAAMAKGAAASAPIVVGAINRGPARDLMASIINKEYNPELYAAILRGKHPEVLLDEGVAGGKPIYNSLPGNMAYRYETSRPLFDEGVVHYDVAGGHQMADVIANYAISPTGDRLSRAAANRNIAGSQIRRADISSIPEEAAIYEPYDKWLYARTRPTVPKGQYQFYVNEVEGNPSGIPQGPAPKIRDILNDPELRYAYNLSLAAPADSPFHVNAEILRAPRRALGHK